MEVDRGTCKLLIATTNQGKFSEINKLLEGCPFDLMSLSDVGITDEVEETGSTFEQNAILKAQTYHRLSGLPTLADDSGIEVEALDGQPGVLSAHFAGKNATDSDNIDLLLERLADIPSHRLSARFRCVIAISWTNQHFQTFTGDCQGMITRTPRGENGFGYDPIFYVRNLDKTIAELLPETKLLISHRGVAARKAVQWLQEKTNL